MKPTTVSGPQFTLDATMPHAHRVLSALAERMTLAGAPVHVIATVERVAEKMRTYSGDGEVPKWLVVSDRFGMETLSDYAGRLERGSTWGPPSEDADLIANLKTLARGMKQSIADRERYGRGTVPVSVIPERSSIMVQVEPDPPIPPTPLRVTVSIGAESYAILFESFNEADYTKSLVSDLIHTACLLRATPAECERWEVGKDGVDRLVTKDNPHMLTLHSEIERLLSRLRAVGALRDAGPIDKRDQPDFIAFMKEPVNVG